MRVGTSAFWAETAAFWGLFNAGVVVPVVGAITWMVFLEGTKPDAFAGKVSSNGAARPPPASVPGKRFDTCDEKLLTNPTYYYLLLL